MGQEGPSLGIVTCASERKSLSAGALFAASLPASVVTRRLAQAMPCGSRQIGPRARIGGWLKTIRCARWRSRHRPPKLVALLAPFTLWVKRCEARHDTINRGCRFNSSGRPMLLLRHASPALAGAGSQGIGPASVGIGTCVRTPGRCVTCIGRADTASENSMLRSLGPAGARGVSVSDHA
jgi:hypothetical protein